VFVVGPYIETLVFVPLHLEIDIVISSAYLDIANNHVGDLVLYADPPPQSG
jgi:hypothetical protein